MTDDPWKGIPPPNADDAITALRVDEDIPWGFFWARDVDRKCLFVLQHTAESIPQGHLPKLKEIEVTCSTGKGDLDQMLVFKLLDTAHRDIFQRLCMDIIASAKDASFEKEVVKLALSRTWRWHHLLRGGGDALLSSEAQKGLIGELLVMERHLLPLLSAVDAVLAWRGPMGAPKDFEIGRICIEAKARRGAATPYISISSEHQLDITGVDELFLHVAELDRAPSDAQDGFTVSDMAKRVREKVRSADNGAVSEFEALLSAVGFRWEDDYSSSLWIEGPSRLYRASGEFPHISAQDLTSGVSKVRYSISLVECAPFLVQDNVLKAALNGEKHAN